MGGGVKTEGGREGGEREEEVAMVDKAMGLPLGLVLELDIINRGKWL